LSAAATQATREDRIRTITTKVKLSVYSLCCEFICTFVFDEFTLLYRCLCHRYAGYRSKESRACSAYNSFEGYSTLVVGSVSSFIDLMLTNRDKMAADPALSLVPEARAPPNGCCPTTAPVLIVSQRADYNLHMGHLPVLLQLI
jgi:hypothetical protein